MGKSRRELKKVKSDVYGIINLVADSYGIKVPKSKMPKVKIGQAFTRYDPEENLIGIPNSKIDIGEGYAAEAGHFLRFYTQDKLYQKATENLEEKKVDEFFDRAASIIAKEKAKGTKYEQLFANRDKDLSSGEGIKKFTKGLKNKRREYNEETQKLKSESEEVRMHNVSHKPPEWRLMPFSFTPSFLKSELDRHKSYMGYVYADQYSAEELLAIPNLYSLPDDEVRKRFFKHHKKGNGLEKIIGTRLIIAGGIIALFNSLITGFSISEFIKTDSFSLLGGLIFMIGLLLL